jgi:hypothetical protein
MSPPPPAAAATAASGVLDNDDLLGEILLRLAFPATLVRAALVCARWLRVASGAAFRRRFRGLHPPPLVGLVLRRAAALPSLRHDVRADAQPPAGARRSGPRGARHPRPPRRRQDSAGAYQ